MVSDDDEMAVGLGMRLGMSVDDTEREVPSSKIMRYCGDEFGSNGISMTVPARFCPDDGLTARTLVPGGYGSLIAGLSSRWRETKRPPSYLIVGYTEDGTR